MTRRWWDQRYRELAEKEVIDRFDRFSIANSSGLTEKFRSVGGFDTGFVGYGLEDHEIGLRLMKAGVFERYDEQAVAWHYNTADQHLAVARNRETGRNVVRLLEDAPRSRGSLVRRPVRRPRTVAAGPSPSPSVAPAPSGGGPGGRMARQGSQTRPEPGRGLTSGGWPWQRLHAAGVADLDRSLVPSFLGRPARRNIGPVVGPATRGSSSERTG